MNDVVASNNHNGPNAANFFSAFASETDNSLKRGLRRVLYVN